MAADHGVAAEGVSAYPQEVTGQMLLNFARGGAAINVLARQAGARSWSSTWASRIRRTARPEIRARDRPGHRQLHARPGDDARAGAGRADRRGAALADELARDGVGLIGIGEMGIGNTTAVERARRRVHRRAARRGHRPRHRHRRRDARRKIDVVAARRSTSTARRRATRSTCWRRSAASRSPAWPASCSARAAARVPVVVDGFIASVGGAGAVRLAPHARGVPDRVPPLRRGRATASC